MNEPRRRLTNRALHGREEWIKRIFRDQIAEAAGILEVVLSGIVLIALLMSIVPLLRLMPGLLTDANDNELHVGDYVRICGHIGKIVFSCGAFGIFIADEVPWDALEELVRKDSGNRPSFLYNDTFISFWEIVWNLSEDTDEPCLPYVESITVTGGIFTDENGNKDVFMGCINGCSATLTQCEYTCGRYYTCDTVAVANDLLRDDERHEKENN